MTTYSVGTGNVVRAMRERGLRRIVCVSSKELDEDGTSDEPLIYRFVLARLLGRVNRTLYADMRRMEGLLRGSDRDWTIVRLAGLFAADHVGDHRCPVGDEPGVLTSIADLADLLVRSTVEALHVGETVRVLTDTGTPPFLVMLARQSTLQRR